MNMDVLYFSFSTKIGENCMFEEDAMLGLYDTDEREPIKDFDFYDDEDDIPIEER
jgi:hypothetical protein